MEVVSARERRQGGRGELLPGDLPRDFVGAIVHAGLRSALCFGKWTQLPRSALVLSSAVHRVFRIYERGAYAYFKNPILVSKIKLGSSSRFGGPGNDGLLEERLSQRSPKGLSSLSPAN